MFVADEAEKAFCWVDCPGELYVLGALFADIGAAQATGLLRVGEHFECAKAAETVAAQKTLVHVEQPKLVRLELNFLFQIAFRIRKHFEILQTVWMNLKNTLNEFFPAVAIRCPSGLLP